ncbi:MAG: UbiX family flavin prenyltransferase [Thermodesulfobacteriota bacterium]
MASCIVAITGASGAVYGVRLTEELLAGGYDVELIISPSGFLILREELGLAAASADAARSVLEHIDRQRASRGKDALSGRDGAGRLTFHPHDDLTGAPASGSALMRAMVVCPCSMGTMARVAAGVSGSLIERAADCVLKERGTLVLVPRETPLNIIHLDNMRTLASAGAVILPAMPAFYHGPESVDDMVDFIVGKTLDALGVDNSLYKRWKGS